MKPHDVVATVEVPPGAREVEVEARHLYEDVQQKLSLFKEAIGLAMLVCDYPPDTKNWVKWFAMRECAQGFLNKAEALDE